MATTTTLTAAPNPSLTGGNVTFTATVRNGATPVTTGTVTFTDGANTPRSPGHTERLRPGDVHHQPPSPRAPT